MAGSQIPTSVTIIDSLSGYQALSLTEMDSSAAAAIAAGSKVEIAGAFFNFPGDETINATSWTAIATSSTAFVQLIPAGTAGTQTVTAEYTSTAPTWRDDLQGWYASAGSLYRVVASVYKAESTSYIAKQILATKQDVKTPYRMQGVTVILATAGSSTWTVPADVYKIKVRCIGGGGGGGGGNSGANYGSGAGGGGTNPALVTPSMINVYPGQSISYTVGAGGTGASAISSALGGRGGSGGTTLFTGATSGAGSTGGQSGWQYPAQGGDGPSIVGSAGGSGQFANSSISYCCGGHGGGAGGMGGAISSAPTAGRLGGGGGGGSSSAGGGAEAGANGGVGCIIIEY